MLKPEDTRIITLSSPKGLGKCTTYTSPELYDLNAFIIILGKNQCLAVLCLVNESSVKSLFLNFNFNLDQ